MSIQTSWTKPTGLNRGQDHLATRAICEILYSRLLPGITNVTDRARYYTLYPWLLWVMDQEKVASEARTTWFRKADCLLTLISLHHGAGAEHSRAAVGSITLHKALQTLVDTGEPIVLSRWARSDNHPDRYFANKRGGLGQYYLGPLESLGVVAWDKEGGLTWSTTHGRNFAAAVDGAVDRQRFLSCVSEDRVELADLEVLQGLCLCGLANAQAERDALLKLMWADPTRRHTLGLILSLAKQRPAGTALDLPTFRGSTVSGYLSSGLEWHLPPSLERARAQWAVYQRSEWLSIAVQGLFWSTLQDLGVNTELASFAAFGDAGVHAFGDDIAPSSQTTFKAALDELKKTLPKESDWTHLDHEHMRAHRISKPKTAAQVARDALAIILSLIARGPLSDAASALRVTPRQREQYPVNLVALNHRKEAWAGLTLHQILHDLITAWGLRLHDRVALRKLRNQLNDTFQIRHTHQGTYRVEAIPEPVFGSPRFYQAVRILQDLGALDRERNRPTELGLGLLEGLNG